MLTSPPVPPVAPALLPPWAPLASMQIEPGTALAGTTHDWLPGW